MQPSNTKRERGRPVIYTREQIVSRVMQLFWTRGYNDLSLNGIAKELGLNRSSIYNSFKNKDELFLECLTHYLDTSPTRHLANHVPGQAVGPLLQKVLNDICELRSSDEEKRGCFMTNSSTELATGDSNLGKLLVEKNKAREKGMLKVISCAIEQGELNDADDPVVMTNLITSFMVGLNMHAKKSNSFDELQNMSNVFLQKIGFEDLKRMPIIE